MTYGGDLRLSVLAGEEAAGGHDVLTPRGADGAGDAVGVEVVLEARHSLGRGGLEGDVGRGVETDEVDAAIESAQQADQLGGMGKVVVHAAEHGVFEGYAPLAAPVVAAQEGDDIGDGVCLLHGHDVEALGGHGVVETDGHVALALVEEPFQSGEDAHGGDGDAVGAPAQAPRGGEHFGAAEDGVEVVHGFAHAHIDDVGEAPELGDGENLAQDVGGREVAVEALLAGDAEAAAHLAAYLARDAEGGPVAVGDIDGFDITLTANR